MTSTQWDCPGTERVRACLRSALGTAVKMRLVAFNAARDVELPKVSKKWVKPWQPAELGTYLDAVQTDRLGALFERWPRPACAAARRAG